jgi:hypothetical protein
MLYILEQLNFKFINELPTEFEHKLPIKNNNIDVKTYVTGEEKC